MVLGLNHTAPVNVNRCTLAPSQKIAGHLTSPLDCQSCKMPCTQGQLFPLIEANDPAHIPHFCCKKTQANVNGLNFILSPQNMTYTVTTYKVFKWYKIFVCLCLQLTIQRSMTQFYVLVEEG